MKTYPFRHILLVAIFGALGCGSAHAQEKREVDKFNYLLGTQTFGVRYQFTEQSPLVETATAIRDLGSNTLKFMMGPKSLSELQNLNAPKTAPPEIHNLSELAREPSYRQVFEMPFAHYLIWTYAFTAGWWDKGFSDEDAAREHKEIYDFAAQMLRTYNGSGKTFYLGHWEGDWYLHPNYDASKTPTPEATQGMIRWLQTRQKALEDAKRDTPHHDVEIYQYTEVNLVQKALKGERALVNAVLPQSNVDFVSYSSYDSTNPENSAQLLPAALDFIEANLPPKPEFKGKRVFIGEYGYPSRNHAAPAQQKRALETMIAAIKWGCPFVLWWEMYDNEHDEKGYKGWGLIDENGLKQPMYALHESYFRWAKTFVAEFEKREKRAPHDAEFRSAALTYLSAVPPL